MGNIVNGENGYIIAGENVAPWEARKDLPRSELPNTKWTDIMAVQWKQYGPAGSDLKRVYRSKVVYSESKRLMESALEKTGNSGDLDELPLWPGVDFRWSPRPRPSWACSEALMPLVLRTWSSSTGPSLARRGSTRSSSGKPRVLRQQTCYSTLRTFHREGILTYSSNGHYCCPGVFFKGT
jgi:hypothetical protein